MLYLRSCVSIDVHKSWSAIVLTIQLLKTMLRRVRQVFEKLQCVSKVSDCFNVGCSL